MNHPVAFDRVFLVGISGAGKSSVGAALARRLGWQVIDTDAEIVRRAELPIHRIFEECGEPAFRALEREVVRAACSSPRRVVALGGGAFSDTVTRAKLLDAGLVVWLRVDATAAAARLAPSLGREPRPLLGGDLPARLRELAEARRADFEQAHVHIDTDGRTIDEVMSRVLRTLSPVPAG